jgi:hypothetical protein
MKNCIIFFHHISLVVAWVVLFEIAINKAFSNVGNNKKLFNSFRFANTILM